MLRYIDGYDYFPTGTGNDTRLEAAGYYIRAGQGLLDQVSTPNNMTTGRFGFGNCLQWSTNVLGSQGNRLQLVRPVDPGNFIQEGVLGLAVYIGRGSVVPFDIMLYDAVADAPQITVEFLPNGIVRAFVGSASGTLIGSTYAGTYFYDQWFYVEIKAKIAASGGTLEVRINTVPIIQVPSWNTQATGNAYFDSYCLFSRIISIGSQFVAAVDDLYVLDTTGTVNNDWLGNVRVKTQFPAGAGAHTAFSIGGSAATNWQAASNRNIDDTSYVFDPTVGDYDLYTVQAIVNGPVVHGVQVRSAMRQDDSTQRVGHNQVQTGATLSNGTRDHYLNQTYAYYTDIWELNPATSVGWTGTEVNAIQIGPRVNA